MGFKEPVRTGKLVFEGTDYDGAIVRCRLNVPMSTFFSMQRVAESDDTSQVETILEEFGTDILSEWNVEDQDGTPLPATGEGFKRISPTFSIMILRGWVKAVTQVPDPLGAPSANGSTSPVGSEGTERELASLSRST